MTGRRQTTGFRGRPARRSADGLCRTAKRRDVPQPPLQLQAKFTAEACRESIRCLCCWARTSCQELRLHAQDDRQNPPSCQHGSHADSAKDCVGRRAGRGEPIVLESLDQRPEPNGTGRTKVGQAAGRDQRASGARGSGRRRARQGHEGASSRPWSGSRRRRRRRREGWEGEAGAVLVAEGGHLDALKLLRRHGANLEATSPNGRTALMGAAINGKADCAEALLEWGADKDAADNAGDTALHKAAREGQLQCARLLVRARVDRAKKNKDGQTALELARDRGRGRRLPVRPGPDRAGQGRVPGQLEAKRKAAKLEKRASKRRKACWSTSATATTPPTSPPSCSRRQAPSSSTPSSR